MENISLSKFKVRCIAFIKQVEKTKTPLRITRYGKPIAEIIPVTHDPSSDWIGSMKDSMEILGDIVSPCCDKSEWEVEN